MISDEVYALQRENAELRERIAIALRRLSELEAAKSGRSAGRARKNWRARNASLAWKTAQSAAPTHSASHIRAFTRRELRRDTRPGSGQIQVERHRAPRAVIHSIAPCSSLGAAPSAASAQPTERMSGPLAHPVVARQAQQTQQAQRSSMLARATSNTLMLLGGQIVTWASTLILAAAYGRFLGAQGFGELYLATTFTALIGFPIEFSFNQQIVRDVAQKPQAAHRYLTMALALKGALWVALYALTILLSYVLRYSAEQRWLIAVCGLMLVSTAISTTLVSIQTASMQIGMAKFGVVMEKGIDCILAVLLLRAGAGVQTVALVLLFGSCIGMGWQVSRVARLIGIRLVWDVEIARTLIRSGVSFLVYGVLGVIYYRIDTVLLSIFASEAVVGVYGAAYRLLDTLMFVPGIVISGVVLPILAKYSADDGNKLRLTVEKSVMAMLLCSLPAAAGLIVVAPNIIGFVYRRSDFAGSEPVLQVLAIGLVALYLNTVLTTTLVSTGQERKLPLMAVAALVFNVALNWVLIPRFAGVGAAWATSLTEILLLGIGAALIDRSLIPVRLWVSAGKITLATLAMALVAHLLDAHTIVVIIPIAAVVYVAAIALLRVLPSEDLLQLRGVLSRFIAPRARGVTSEQAPQPEEVPEFALPATSTELEAVS
jgi:O-antigen/teichoic acid export membrane protein